MTVYREATIQDKRYRAMKVVPDARVRAIVDMWSADYRYSDQYSDHPEEIREAWPALGELLDALAEEER